MFPPIQIKSNEKRDEHISVLKEKETGSKKDADLLLFQGLTTPDLIMSTCSQNESSFCGESNYPE